VLRNVHGVVDVALRRRPDETLDAYVSVAPLLKLVVGDLTTALSLLTPGYAIPTHMYLIHGPLACDLFGSYDYERMEKQALDNDTDELDKQQLLIRDIFAEILDVDPTNIRKDSDFFLLGGNSLLLGKLSFHLRKKLGVNIGVTELFSESTIQGIAALIEDQSGLETDADDVTKQNATNASSYTVSSTNYDAEHDPEYSGKRRGRSQGHPLCLAVQTIPFLIFYPFKHAFTCASAFPLGNYCLIVEMH